MSLRYRAVATEAGVWTKKRQVEIARILVFLQERNRLAPGEKFERVAEMDRREKQLNSRMRSSLGALIQMERLDFNAVARSKAGMSGPSRSFAQLQASRKLRVRTLGQSLESSRPFARWRV